MYDTATVAVDLAVVANATGGIGSGIGAHVANVAAMAACNCWKPVRRALCCCCPSVKGERAMEERQRTMDEKVRKRTMDEEARQHKMDLDAVKERSEATAWRARKDREANKQTLDAALANGTDAYFFLYCAAPHERHRRAKVPPSYFANVNAVEGTPPFVDVDELAWSEILAPALTDVANPLTNCAYTGATAFILAIEDAFECVRSSGMQWKRELAMQWERDLALHLDYARRCVNPQYREMRLLLMHAAFVKEDGKRMYSSFCDALVDMGVATAEGIAAAAADAAREWPGGYLRAVTSASISPSDDSEGGDIEEGAAGTGA